MIIPLTCWKDSSLNSKEIIFKFKFEYFNSTSARYILAILKKLDGFYRGGVDIKIKWHYVDELDKESGKEYYEIVKMRMIIPFEIVSKDK
ncbi:MAG: DUF1987 family protein [Bacteroidetes bacterium]|nr:DUF1987 family protein [Bacteroidota bacterium]